MLEEGKTVPLYTLTVLLNSTERYGSELLLILLRRVHARGGYMLEEGTC